MNPQEALHRLIAQEEIMYAEMISLMRQMMRGEISPILIAAIITGFRIKKETIGEIAAAAQVMREFATRVDVHDNTHLVDTCGTGGDSTHTFNISTTAAFVAAAAGARVAKHGGRSVSSKSGSADVLEALGINLNQTPQQVAQSISEFGLGFMFAPNYHSAMKYAAPVRQELGVKTLFNILGPLTNPASAKRQVLGVFNNGLVKTLAHVLQQLGSQHVLIVNGEDGMDEITITGKTNIGELKNGQVETYSIRPEDFNLRTYSIEAIQVTGAKHAKEILLSVLENVAGPTRDIVLLNAGAAIYTAGIVNSLEQGIIRARQAIESGAAFEKLHQLIEFTQKNSTE